MSKPRIARRILVVDDTEADREAIERFLAADRATHVAFSATIEEGVALAKKHFFDLALVDWMLPDGSGPEFGARLEGTGVVLPFVLMTGQERPRQVDDALAHGAIDFLAKSDLSERVVTRVCEHAIVRARLARELAEARRAEQTASRLEREARASAERALADQAQLTERVSRLHLLTSLFSAAVTTEQVARGLIAHSAVFGRPTAAGFYVLREEELVLLESHGFEDVERWTRVPLAARTPVTEAVHRGQVLRVGSPAELRETYGLSSALGDTQQEWVFAPLGNDTHVHGVIVLRFSRGDQPLSEEIDFVRLVAELASQAMVRARLYEEASRRADFESRLLAIVGHDLRTPLSVVVTASQLLEAKYPDEKLLPRLQRSAFRMSELIDDVMKRSEGFVSGLNGEDLAPIDLTSVVEESAQELRAAFPGRAIDVASAGPLHAKLNATRVTQIVSNLVRNAVQHGSSDRPVTVTLAPPQRGELMLSVHNEGEPIAPEAIPSLFDPFKRGDRASGRGAGLGLFIVYELVTGMGGRIEVESGAAGTRFAVHLPLVARSVPSIPPPIDPAS